ncbi:hypothetical protein [Kitasatospora sp. NPDC086791]|uniref:hypothetical protein n=1 Tax=Kitasatospora sp. NPDC086791 TaxID=3155178 RepID=UPI00343281B2
MSYRIGAYREPKRVVARYRTASGRTIEVREGWDCDSTFYEWTCPGCGAKKPLIVPSGERGAKQTAEAHAKSCTAV